VAGPFVVTVRHGARVERGHHTDLDDAVAWLEARLRELRPEAERDALSFLGHTFAPVQQVAARGELAGPRGLRAGVDLRGDGSAEAWTGRWRRRLVMQGDGEDAYTALRRHLRGQI
jgi:hypothetical protein